ncbi:hypothetical protein [Pseudooceanicola sp. LIPI14-2-Ac024]|uniref:hypothetical protein n=1 Tax=Pseudooceanicola sp. LIPI14-2-Ac024 TaxID=3344875 RepID=UPI0035CF119B
MTRSAILTLPLVLAACLPAATPSQPTASIPEAMHGRWGLTANDCTPGRADAKGLMTVAPDTLAFYESRARLVQGTTTGPGQLSGDFAFTGEGMTWQVQIDLVLGPDGRTLTRVDTGPDAMPGPLVYTICG